MANRIEDYMDQEQMTSLEGRRGVINLARVCRAIGYMDRNYKGQLDANASVGDIMDFLEDNSGAIEAVISWISKQRNADWEESVNELMYDEEEEEEE